MKCLLHNSNTTGFADIAAFENSALAALGLFKLICQQRQNKFM